MLKVHYLGLAQQRIVDNFGEYKTFETLVISDQLHQLAKRLTSNCAGGGVIYHYK